MWEYIGAVGGLLGGAGALSSGLSSFFDDTSSGLKGKDMKQAIKIQMKHRLKYARMYGKKFGFHPLAALGINPAMGGQFMRAGFDNRGAAFQRMGQGS